MARIRVAVAAAVMVLGLAGPAFASDASEWEGGCSFGTVNDTTPGGTLGGQAHWTGEIHAALVLYSRTHNNVVNATVTCHLLVNGVDVLQLTASGTSVVAFADRITFDAQVTDLVELCTEVDFTSDTTPTTMRCAVPTETRLIPEYVVDWLDYGVGVADAGLVTYVDPAICGASGGDVYVDDQFLYDCPPYEWGDPGGPGDPPPPPPPLPPFTPDGAGWNDGDTGFLALTGKGIGATCSFHRDGDSIAVTGAVATAAADSSTLHCVLKDAATGTVFYDATAPAAIHDTVPAIDGKATVCTEASGSWGADTVTVGQYCRPGLPI